MVTDIFGTIFAEYRIGFCLAEETGNGFRILQANDAFAKILGVEVPLDVDLEFSHWCEKLFAKDCTREIFEAMQSRKPFTMEIVRRDADEKTGVKTGDVHGAVHLAFEGELTTRHLEVRVFSLPESAVAICLRDVSDKIYEEKRRVASQKLEGMGLLAQGIAHDFNNLLSGILGMASLARMSIHENDAMALTLDDIIRISENAKGLTEKLLSYGRGQTIHETTFDIEPLVRDMLKVVKMGMPKGKQIECNVAEGNHFMKGDPGEISQVILNIFKNAVEAIDPYRGKVRIDLKTERLAAEGGEGQIMLRVSDDGIGMDAKTLEQIFKPFFSTKRIGRGLGMTVVDKLIEKHRGRLAIDSKSGRGTTVSLTLPAVIALPSTEMPAALGSIGGWEKVVMIDGDPVFTRAIGEYMRRLGYSVECFTAGIDAVRHIEDGAAGSTNMIICELPPPDMSASELAWYFIETAPLARILFTSGSDDVSDVADIFNEGLADFIQKPYTPAELIAKMRAMLDENTSE